MPHRSRPTVPTDRGAVSGGVLAFVVLAAAVAVWLALDDWGRTQLINFLHAMVPAAIPLLLLFVAGVVAYAAPKVLRVILTLAIVAGVAGTITYWVRYGYEVKRVYAAAVQIVDEDMPTFAERSAYPVADAQAKSNLGDVLGTLGPVRYVPDGDTDSWNALVTRRGFWTGYEVVEKGDVPLTGRATATTCEFDDQASARLGGHFAHSLDRKIAAVRPGATFEATDAYGYCDGDTPIVVVPLQRLQGFWYVTRTPAGVALYDGHSGQVTVQDSVKDGEIPGPVFPMSLAATLRTSTEALGSFSDYWHSRSGYDPTPAVEADPNHANPTEFNLRLDNGKGGAYVTPLTPKGASESITAVSVVSSTNVTAGKWNDIVVHTYDKKDVRRPGSAIAQAIKGDYGDLPEWAAGMQIFEITPNSSEEWIASLGQRQDIMYRVRVKPNGDSCLEYASGDVIRCGKATGEGGNGVGVALQPGTGQPGSGPVRVPNGGDLSALTDAELAALQQQITSELLARINAKDSQETETPAP